MKIDILSMSHDEIAALMEQWGEPSYRAGQLFSSLHKNNVRDFSEITTFPKTLRELCMHKCYINSPKMKKRLVSATHNTVKYLYELSDAHCIECVLMFYRHGASLCISTQVGCRMGCAFCASTQGGLIRNLTASEMLGQIYESARQSGHKISSVVLMGIGEPLDNFDNVVRFLELIAHPEGLNLSLRHVSLSTCGLPGQIDRLSQLKLGLTLSISLHAVTDDERSAIMPVNRRYPIDVLLKSCRAYYKKTGRRISFEYALIKDQNDTPAHAAKLAALLRGFPCHVNLIPINPVSGLSFRKSPPENAQRFKAALEQKGLNATIRRELGTDIMAACGQLRLGS